MNPLIAVMIREGRIRATNLLFIFWDVVYPLGYLLVFGVGIDHAVQLTAVPTVNYNNASDSREIALEPRGGDE